MMCESKALSERQTTDGFPESPSTQDLFAILRQITEDEADEQDSQHLTKERLFSSIDLSYCIPHSNESATGTVSGKVSVADTDHEVALCKKLSLAKWSRSHPGRSRRSGSQLGSGIDVAENSGRLRQLIGNPADDPTANPIYTTRRDGCVKLRKFHPDGTTILLLTNKYPGKMEDFESLDGSDCSNLSTTQENDPVAYEGIRQLLDSESFSTSSGRNQPVRLAPDTGSSYTDNDTGHIKLDFSPQPVPLHALDGDSENGELPNKPGMAGALQGQDRNPQTPAQPRFVPNNPGTVMRASQMFLETQPSPGSRDHQGIGLSSDKPTPGFYHNHRFQNYESSPLISPLIQRAEKHQPARLAASHCVTSPLELPGDRVANKSRTPLPQNFRRTQGQPELYHTYETRKESQDRRNRMAITDKDDNQSSDDGFSDSETEMSRRARRARDAAAREIAGVRASIPPPNLKSDEVEVPSTSNRRRRSRSEAYVSRCNEDTRNSQDITIVDSQSVPVATALEDSCSTPESNGFKPVEPAANISVDPISSRYSSVSSTEGSNIRSSALPRLEQDAECETTEGDTGAIDFSARKLALLTPIGVCSNRNLTCSPDGYKTHPLLGGDALIPETSPLEPHQHQFAVLEHNFTEAISPEELDEIENPLTQDDAFNEAVKSPSPQLQSHTRSFKWSKPEQQRRTETKSGLVEKVIGSFDFNQGSLEATKKDRNSPDISRRMTRKNKALPIISTPNTAISTPNTALPTSTSKPATRSPRQASVTSEKSKIAESEERATSTASHRRKPTPSHMIAGDPDFFHNMVFSVSYVNRMEEKKRVVQLIKQYGGQLLENGFDELFDFAFSGVTTPARSPEPVSDSGSTNLTLTTEAQNIGFICLIADEHSRKAKYMQALALGLPCVSGRWIEHCVARGQILDWDPYLLAAGESTFLGGAVHNRNLQPYCATTARFARHFEERKKLLEKKSVLLIMGKGRAEERKKAYLFLTQALGAHRVKRVYNNQEAKKALLESESRGELWSLLYVDEKEEAAEKAIFGTGPSRKRKRGSACTDESNYPVPKKVRIISDEFVIQSLILGKLLDED